MRDSSEQDTEGLLQEGSKAEILLPLHRRTTSWWQSTLRALNSISPVVVLLIVTNTASFLFIMLISATRQSSPHSVSQPPAGVTPSLAKLGQLTSPQLLNVTFYPYDNIFRQHQSIEAEERWLDYELFDGGYIMIPEEEASAAGIDPTRHAYVDRPDLGMVGYPVQPEGIHQIHCLNMLRRNLYYNREYSKANCRGDYCVDSKLESWDILHIDHCLEMLRHRIACTADLGIVPFIWYQHSGKLTGETARMHTCNDFEALRDFVKVHGVRDPPLGGPNALKPPKDAYVLQEYV